MNEVNLDDSDEMIELMKRTEAAGPEIAPQRAARSLWLDAQAGLTAAQSSWMSLNVEGWVN